MAKEIALENERISNFQKLVTLTLDRVILHTVMHHSSTSTNINMPNFTEIEETFCGRTYTQTDGRTFETHFIRSTQKSRLDLIKTYNTEFAEATQQKEKNSIKSPEIKEHTTIIPMSEPVLCKV